MQNCSNQGRSQRGCRAWSTTWHANDCLHRPCRAAAHCRGDASIVARARVIEGCAGGGKHFCAAPELLGQTPNCPRFECLQVARPNNILAFVQALIYCHRYKDAACRCDELMPGVDRLYLQAQAAWRAGDLAPALQFLDAAVAISPESQKCQELHRIVSCLASRWAAAQDAFDDGVLRVCLFANNSPDPLNGTLLLPADYPLIECTSA